MQYTIPLKRKKKGATKCVAAASIQVATCEFTCSHIQDKQHIRKLFNSCSLALDMMGEGRQVFYALHFWGFFICAYIFIYC